jgi:fucose 4-O-acetylase-like acetyltransferase
MPVKIGFIFWQAHLQAFFMGLLFFLAGVFAQRSLARRGPREFVRDRLIRLGLPALLYMLLIQPFIVYVLLGHPHIPDRPQLALLYWRYLVSGQVFSGNGPLWFALALLVFCLVLAGWRAVRPASVRREELPVNAPGAMALLAFGGIVVIATFVVRLVQPLGTNVLNFQLCYFPQYIAAFTVGVAAGRRGWLDALVTSHRARLACWLGMVGGPMLLAAVIWFGGIPANGDLSRYEGGWHPQAFGLALWEQFAGIGLGLGLMSRFHRHLNDTGNFAAWLSQRSFAVYVLHAPVLVAFTLAMRPVAADAFTHMAVLTVVGLVASFLVADLAKRLPIIGEVL